MINLARGTIDLQALESRKEVSRVFENLELVIEPDIEELEILDGVTDLEEAPNLRQHGALKRSR
jgi:hypothetical protein